MLEGARWAGSRRRCWSVRRKRREPLCASCCLLPAPPRYAWPHVCVATCCVNYAAIIPFHMVSCSGSPHPLLRHPRGKVCHEQKLPTFAQLSANLRTYRLARVSGLLHSSRWPGRIPSSSPPRLSGTKVVAGLRCFNSA